MRWTLVAVMIGAAAWLSGCVTSKTAEYLDPKTGHLYLCHRQAAFGAIPAGISGSAYADCKSLFERRGFVRSDPKN